MSDVNKPPTENNGQPKADATPSAPPPQSQDVAPVTETEPVPPTHVDQNPEATSKVDSPKNNSPKVDTSKADSPKVDASKAESPKADNLKTDSPKPQEQLSEPGTQPPEEVVKKPEATPTIEAKNAPVSADAPSSDKKLTDEVTPTKEDHKPAGGEQLAGEAVPGGEQHGGEQKPAEEEEGEKEPKPVVVVGMSELQQMLATATQNLSGMTNEDAIKFLIPGDIHAQAIASARNISTHFIEQATDLAETMKLILKFDQLVIKKIEESTAYDYGIKPKTDEETRAILLDRAQRILDEGTQQYQASHKISKAADPLIKLRYDACDTTNAAYEKIMNAIKSEKEAAVLALAKPVAVEEKPEVKDTEGEHNVAAEEKVENKPVS